MTDSIVRIEEIKAATDSLGKRIDAYNARVDSAREDATRKEKYQALRGPESTSKITITPALPATKPAGPEPRGTPPAARKDPKAEAALALSRALEPLRQKGAVRGMSVSQAVARKIQDLTSGRIGGTENGEKDAAGAIWRNGAAYVKGMVVQAGGLYHPKGMLGGTKRDLVFLCKNVEWQQGGNRSAGPKDRLIAVGDLKIETSKGTIPGMEVSIGAGAGASRNRWFYVTDLKPSDFFG